MGNARPWFTIIYICSGYGWASHGLIRYGFSDAISSDADGSVLQEVSRQKVNPGPPEADL
jgi:hypothetical protein